MVVLLALPLLARFADLEADPPLNVDMIHPFATDEGYYTFHARSVVLFKEATPPDFWDNSRVSPLFDGLVQLSFALMGVGLTAMRLPQVLLGIGTVGLLYLVLRREAGPAAAYWGALFLAWNQVWFVYNRVGVYYNLLIFLLTGCAAAWLVGWRRPHWFVLSGILAGLALLTSLYSLMFLGGLGIATIVLLKREQKKTLILFWPAGLAVVLLPTLFFFVLPRWGLILRDLHRSGALPFYTSPLQLVANLLLFLYNPFFLLSVLPLLGILLYTGRMLRRGISRGPLDILLLSWFWSGAAALAFINYRPTRYFLYLLVPMCAALALVVTHWEEYLRVSPARSLVATGPLLVLGMLVVRDQLGPRRFQGSPLWWGGVLLAGAVALGASILVVSDRRPVLRRLGALVSICLLLSSAAVGLAGWTGRQHSLVQVSRELGQLLPSDALLLRGCTLTLENRLHCLPMIEPEEVDPAALSGYRLFYLTESPSEGLPGDRLWGTWPIFDKVMHLYEVAPGRRSLRGLDMGHF